MANNLINTELLKNVVEVVSSWTPQEKAISYLIIDKELDKVKTIIKSQLINSTLEEVEFCVNDIKKVLKIIRGKETIKQVTNKTIDYEKAILFAKEHNLHLPMTERIIVEPEVNISLLENQVWFQEHVNDFVVSKIDEVKSKSYDTIKILDKKC